MFKKRATPSINRCTRVTTSSATLIDNIFINCVFDASLKNGIIKTYRPISLLPVFTKTVEKIKYNQVYNYFAENQLLFPKQFGFQISTLTEHAVLELVRNTT